MTGGEHETQEIVADLIVERPVEIRGGHPGPGLGLATKLLLLALEQRSPAQQVDRTMLSGGHKPGARIVRDARLRPLLERRDESILSQLLGETDVAHDAR